MMIVSPREERLAAQHLCQNASNGPYVDGLGVLLEREHDFRRAVPSRRDVFSHEPGFSARRLGGFYGSCKTKVADLEVAVGIEEQVRGFEVAVDDIGAVECFERAKGLVDKVLARGQYGVARGKSGRYLLEHGHR